MPIDDAMDASDLFHSLMNDGASVGKEGSYSNYGLWVPISFSQSDENIPELVIRINSKPNNLFYSDTGKEYLNNKTNICRTQLLDWEKPNDSPDIETVYFYCDQSCCHLECCQLNISIVLTLVVSVCFMVVIIALTILKNCDKDEMTWTFKLYQEKRHKLIRMNATKEREQSTNSVKGENRKHRKRSRHPRRVRELSVTGFHEIKHKISRIEEEDLDMMSLSE